MQTTATAFQPGQAVTWHRRVSMDKPLEDWPAKLHHIEGDWATIIAPKDRYADGRYSNPVPQFVRVENISPA